MLEIGSVIDGKYKILNVIGKGGMSVVYLAMNERANKQWAIKEVRKDGVQNFEVVKQNLIVETDLLKRLNHPHLPSIIDVIDGDGTFLIVMDYIEGNPLSKAIKNSGAQNQDDVIEWAKQLCDVLGYLHSRKPPIIYRDMKPSNVMLKPDGNVILIDFGTAREFKSTSVADTTCLGTQGYAAPEQFGGHGQTDARTDIYCLGATMYHLITGHNPALPPYEMYPIRQWNPMLSSGLEEIILKCTQKNPDDRYQSCAELLYALDHYQDLDIENKKVQSLKWKTFIASVILTLVMLVGSIGFTVALSLQTSSTYEYYMNQAGNSMNEEESAEMYKNAIETDPSKIDGYSALLDLYSNNEFTSQEYESFKNILNKDNYEEIVKSADPAAYADEIAYPLAENLYFNYGSNNSSGIDTSARWFKKAAENSNDDHIKSRSQLLYKMVDSKKNLGTVGKNGDSVVSYVDYWNQLTQLATSDLPETENLKIALHIYNTVAMEIYNNNDSFISGGVTQTEYLAELDKLQGFVQQAHSSTLYTESVDKGTYDALILNCNNAIDSARLALTKKAASDNSSASVWG